MKNKFLLRWNTFKINLIARLIGRLNIKIVDDNALWDTAMNTMEKSAKSDPVKLLNYAGHFRTLAQRAAERADDCEIEKRYELKKAAEEAANDWPDPHLGTMA